jgi:heat shock protein HslJ
MRADAIRFAALLMLLPAVGLAAGASLSDESLRNLEYRGVAEQPVELADGRWEGAPAAPGASSRPRVEIARNGVTRGDLDGDGREEAAVLLLESGGGTGLNHHVAIVAEREGVARNVATALLGDRVQIMRFSVEAGRVSVEAVVSGPDEPMCCPTRKVRWTLALAGSQLETEEEPLGTVGLADLGGRSWQLTRLGVSEMPTSGEPITLELKDGQLVGSAGCNRYFSDAKSEGGLDLALGPAGATRRMCAPEVMENEATFLERLQQVDRFGFVMGDLVLSYRLDGRVGALFFAEGSEKR